MKLIIENLGIIKHAEIDLKKKFTLFCGRNNTGKTYASYILHAFLSDGNVYQLNCIKDIVAQIINESCFRISQDYIKEWLSANCAGILNNIGSIFGIAEATKDKLFSKLSVSVSYTKEDYDELLNKQFKITFAEGTNVWKFEKKEGTDIISVESNFDLTALSSGVSFRSNVFLIHILRVMAFHDISGVRMLTVERNSIYTFKTELSLSRNELIDQIQQTGKREIDVMDIINRSSRRYPYAVRSSLKIANDLENVQKNDSPFSNIADKIEQDLLMGQVSMTKNGDVEFHPQEMAPSKRLPFHLSSSIVKTMASLVIYLRHLAQKGDVLIIDEPEMNFHPDVQIVLARVFAMLTQNGLNLVVSTHSDYIIREVNNLIMAGVISKHNQMEFLNELGYQADMLLNYDDVAVLYFTKTGKNVVRVSPLPVDETGFAVESIDSAINDQNLNAERLYCRLLDNESN